MKKIIFLYIVTLTLFTLFSSCKKSWLEIIPMGSLIAVTTSDFDKIMNDQQFYQRDPGGYGEALLMGDELAAEAPYFVNKNSSDVRDRLFEYRADIYPSSAIPSIALTNNLAAMYELNKVINEVMASTGGTEVRKKGLRAEALASRAWYNFLLVSYYCKPYNASTANTDLGFPRISMANITETSFPRGTVQQSYDFILKDLTDALIDIPQKPTIVTRMSKPAVEAMLGKVYLFMGKYNEALPLLKAALADVTLNGQTTLYDYNATFATGGSFLPVDQTTGPKSPGQVVGDLTEAVVSKTFASGAYGGNNVGNDGLVLTPHAQALYGSNDLRLMFYTTRNMDNTPNTAGRLRKYGVKFSRWGIQLPELYLLNAECKARTNDLNGAVTDLQTLRRVRIRARDISGTPINDALVPTAIAANQTALIRFVIEERIREFAMEGYRWFDMRRLSQDPLFSGTQYVHTKFNANGTTTLYTLEQPNRFVLKIPQNIAEGNPDMVNNP